MHRLLATLVVASIPGLAIADDLGSFNAALVAGDCAKANSVLRQSNRAPLLRGISSQVGMCAPKDENKALEEYRKSAANGDNDGRYSFFVLVGQRGARDEPVSEALWKEAWDFAAAAADAKHSSACRAMADKFHFGIAGPKDEARASHYGACAK